MTIEHIESEMRDLVGDASVKDDYGKNVEDTFQLMKQLATAAGWPAELTPEIKAIDAEWQKVKTDANAAGLSTSLMGPPVLSKMSTMIGRLKAYMKDRGVVKPPAKPSEKPSGKPSAKPETGGSVLDMLKHEYGPLPLWGWGAAVLGVGVIGYFLLPQRRV